MGRHMYWVWLAFLLLIWGITYVELPHVSAIQWLSGALFFSFIFLIPLFRDQQLLTMITIIFASLSIVLGYWSISNIYLLIIFMYLTGEIVYRLNSWYAIGAGAGIVVSMIAVTPFSYLFTVIFLCFLLMTGVITYHQVQKWNETELRYETLLHEYKRLKLKSSSDEKLARQEERTQIGREIHDRVGHKLTNLLMQLEVTRMQADPESKARLQTLKDLAKESLEETRHAVQAMNQEEIGGLPAIIRLIRKLEAENFIQIQFSVKNRAFSAELDIEQTVAIYRAVQEALTNVMRHSAEKEAMVLFESPGESIFRFEVSNPVKENYEYREGFGLTSMKDRLEKVSGQLDIIVYQNRFIVRGSVPIVYKRSGLRGSNTVS